MSTGLTALHACHDEVMLALPRVAVAARLLPWPCKRAWPSRGWAGPKASRWARPRALPLPRALSARAVSDTVLCSGASAGDCRCVVAQESRAEQAARQLERRPLGAGLPLPRAPGAGRRQAALFGLANTTDTKWCYLNAAVQCLWHWEAFRERLLRLPVGALQVGRQHAWSSSMPVEPCLIATQQLRAVRQRPGAFQGFALAHRGPCRAWQPVCRASCACVFVVRARGS